MATTYLPSISVKEFVDGPLKEYSRYTISNRALPSFVDGFKTTSRKLFWLMQSQKEFIKVSALAGRAADKANYHHGDASGSAVSMSTAYAGTNTIPYFISKGEFGSVQNKQAAASRYIFCKYNKIMDYIYKDKELHEKQFDIEDPEPLNFYPIIPTILINAQAGIATGFACKFQSYKPIDILNITRHFVNNIDDVENTPELIPYLKDFKGSIKWDDEKMRWNQVGKWEKINTTTIKIMEVPTTFSRLSYLNYLIKLKNSKYISKYIEQKIDGKDNWNLQIKLSRTSKVWDNPIKMLNLRRSISSNMSCITPSGVVIKYDYPEDLALNFVLYRLKIYTKRIKWQLDRINDSILSHLRKIDFVKVMSNLNFKEMSAKEIQTHCISKGFVDKNELARLMSISISKLNKTGIESFKTVIQNLKNEKQYYENTNEIELYNKDLDDLEVAFKRNSI